MPHHLGQNQKYITHAQSIADKFKIQLTLTTLMTPNQGGVSYIHVNKGNHITEFHHDRVTCITTDKETYGESLPHPDYVQPIYQALKDTFFSLNHHIII